jgi:hypothetical protein
MKLLLILFLTMTLNVFSQQTIKTFASEIGDWDAYNREWVWSNKSYANINFTLNGSVLRATDKANSTYYVIEILEEEDGFISWSSVDESGKDCILMMRNNEVGVDYLLIMYNGLAFRYSFYF